jgi:hypothetical protein
MENQLIENSSYTPSVNIPSINQSPASSQPKTNLMISILLTLLVSGIVFGFGGFYLGKQSASSSQITNYPQLVPTQMVSSSPTSIPSPTISEAMVGWQAYKSSENKIILQAPPNANVVVKPGSIEIKFGSGESPDSLLITYTSNGVNPPGYSGTAAGDPIEVGQIDFLGSKIKKIKFVVENKTTEVFYGGGPGSENVVTRDQFKFITTLNWGLDSKSGIPLATEALADQILSSFKIQ